MNIYLNLHLVSGLVSFNGGIWLGGETPNNLYDYGSNTLEADDTKVSYLLDNCLSVDVPQLGVQELVLP